MDFKMANIAKIIKQKRIALGLTEMEVAKYANMNIYAYGDVESYDYEFLTQLSFIEAYKICRILHLSIFELMDISIEATAPSAKGEGFPALLEIQMDKLNVSANDLADKIGYEHSYISEISTRLEIIRSLCVTDILKIFEILQIDPKLIEELSGEPRN